MATTTTPEKARKALLNLKANNSYTDLTKPGAVLAGFNRGYLSAVANGKRPASATLMRALGLKRPYDPHPVMRRKKIDRAVRRPVVIKGDESGVCATVEGQVICTATLSDLIERLTSQ